MTGFITFYVVYIKFLTIFRTGPEIQDRNPRFVSPPQNAIKSEPTISLSFD